MAMLGQCGLSIASRPLFCSALLLQRVVKRLTDPNLGMEAWGPGLWCVGKVLEQGIIGLATAAYADSVKYHTMPTKNTGGAQEDEPSQIHAVHRVCSFTQVAALCPYSQLWGGGVCNVSLQVIPTI